MTINMSSMTLEENFEALMKNYQAVTSTNEELKNQKEELKSQNKYLQKLRSNIKQIQKVLESPSGSVHGDKEASNLVSSSSEEEPLRRVRRARRAPYNSNDFKIEIPKFEGRLDHDEFLEWLHTVERIFDYKDVPEERK